MSADRRRQAERLFQAVADLPAQERTGFLDQECGTDAALRADVEHLLVAFESDTGDFLDPLSIHQLPTGPCDSAPTRLSSDRLTGTISHYSVERELGRGGMGMVYLAVDSDLDRQVAIKLLPDEFSHDRNRLALFKREARTAAHLNHPNIATIYEFGKFEGGNFIAMEHVEGRPLNEVLQVSSGIPLSEFLDIAVQIAEGLTAAHESNVIHRDLKPGNLMITSEARVKILDFGLAKALQADAITATGMRISSGSTATSTVLGTAGYASPEQCIGDPVDLRSDLFSFGVVLYELATGVAPFKGENVLDTISAVLNDQPEPPTAINADLPSDVADLIEKLLAKRPEDRYQASGDVLADLREVKHRIEAPRHRRLKFATLTLGAAVILLVSVNVWIGGRGQSEPADPRIDEFRTFLGRRQIPEARALLPTMEPDIRPETYMELAEQLRQRRDDLLKELLERLVSSLVNGESANATDIVASISEIDDSGPDYPDYTRAKNLLKEATTLHDHTGVWSERIQQDIAEDRLVRALEMIEELRTWRFHDEAFGPAVDRARELTPKLITALNSRADALFDRPPTEVSIGEITECIALYRTAAPLSDYRPRLRLLELYQEARASQAPQTLRGILTKMDRINRTHPLTRAVREKYESHRQQATTFEEGLDQFRRGNVTGIERAIETYRLIRPSSAKATQELEDLQQAMAWLVDYQKALEYLGTNLDEASQLHDQLELETLPDAFRTDANEHLDHLLNEWKKGTARYLYARIEYFCDTLQLANAQSHLQELKDLGVRGLDAVSLADPLVAQLAKDMEDRLEADKRFKAFRRQLKDMMVTAEPLLAQLEGDWRREKNLLNKAIEREPRAELLKRRATLHVRLGLYGAALEDAEVSLGLEETADGFLLRAQALVGEAHGHQGRTRAALTNALADVRRAIRLNASPRALGLQGMYGTLLLSDKPDRADRDQALGDLTMADELGFKSAYAAYNIAVREP
ncbi:MAG: protein kinase domain-containing protein [Planctomycetota bacterium]